jgi:serine phosphatase RsbU (regulator of sigma subunit)
MSRDLEAASARLFREFLRRTHLTRPDDLADAVAEEAQAALDASDVVMYLVNYEETMLVPVPSRTSRGRPPQAVDGTLAGRAFAAATIHTGATSAVERRRVWAPILDGTDRLGVLEMTVDATEDGEVAAELIEVIERYSHAVAQMVLSKGKYGDVFELVQRSQPMTVGAELLWSVIPPPTYATDGLVISAMLEPAYHNGGDAFDYAVNGSCAHLAVFDGMGHGLEAAGIATFAVAAYRNSRRRGSGLAETYAAMDAAVGNQFGGNRFVTAVLAQLDLDTGRLHWVSAGHPPPLLIRHGKVVKSLGVDPATPLGVPSPSPGVAVGEEHLESGDSLLLFTDGLTEARQPGGGFLTEQGLAEFVQREAAAQRPSPETLRRLRQAILAHQGGALHDDATALLVDWHRGGEELVVPQTVVR